MAPRPGRPALRAVAIVLPVCLPQTFLPLTARSPESRGSLGSGEGVGVFEPGVPSRFVKPQKPGHMRSVGGGPGQVSWGQLRGVGHRP